MSSPRHSDSESSSDDRQGDHDYHEGSQMEEVSIVEPETPPRKAAKAGKRTQSKPKPSRPRTPPPIQKTPVPSKPTTSTNNFTRFLGDQAELLRAAHRDSIDSGYRPNKGIKDLPAQAGGSTKTPKDPKEPEDSSTKSKAGRKPKTQFPLRACVFLTQGVDAYDGTSGPDLGKCYQMQEWGLAVVAESEGGLNIDKTASDADMENYLRDLFPQVFEYLDSAITSAGPTRRSGKKKAAAGHLVTHVKSTGKSRKLQAAKGETIRGSAVVDRFPTGKSWEQRIAYFTGPSKIPSQQLKLWGVPTALQVDLNGEAAGSDEDSNADGVDEQSNAGSEPPEDHATHANNRKSTSKSSKATSTSIRTPALRSASASSKGKRPRSPSPFPDTDEEVKPGAGSRQPLPRAAKRIRADPPEMILIDDDDDQQPGPSTASAPKTTQNLGRKLSELSLLTFSYIDPDVARGLAGPGSDDLW